mgnify:CR=1 FL=1
MALQLFHDGSHHGCAQLQAPTVEGTTPPQTVVFLLDGSGSMACDNKLAHALRAGELCLDHLRPVDTFACVVFHSIATVAIPAQRMSDTNKEIIDVKNELADAKKETSDAHAASLHQGRCDSFCCDCISFTNSIFSALSVKHCARLQQSLAGKAKKLISPTFE